MNEILRERLWRQVEALPEDQVYQVLDYIEFLNSKYARSTIRPPSSAVQRFGEKLEDRLRGNRVGFDAIRSTLNVVGAADRVVSGIAEAGRSILRDVTAPPSAPEQRSAGVLTPPKPASPDVSKRPDVIIDD